MPATKRTGRPVTTGRGHDGVRVNVRLTADEHRTIAAAAERAGETVATRMRRAALLLSPAE